MNTKVFLVLSFFLSFTTFSKAQDSFVPATSQPDKIIRLHILAPGITVETTTGINRTFLYDFTLGFTYQYSNINGNVSTSGDIIPQAKLEWRKYTSIRKRELLSRRTDHYSSQYWAAQVSGGILLFGEEAIISVGGLWGFQTAFARNAYVDIGFGLGIGTDFEAVGIVPIGNFALGWFIE